jgi:hypothetical protein
MCVSRLIRIAGASAEKQNEEKVARSLATIQTKKPKPYGTRLGVRSCYDVYTRPVS